MQLRPVAQRHIELLSESIRLRDEGDTQNEEKIENELERTWCEMSEEECAYANGWLAGYRNARNGKTPPAECLEATHIWHRVMSEYKAEALNLYGQVEHCPDGLVRIKQNGRDSIVMHSDVYKVITG